MIVYKIGCEFPEMCSDCPLCSMGKDMTEGYCGNYLELDENDMWYKRNKSCPLIKIGD